MKRLLLALPFLLLTACDNGLTDPSKQLAPNTISMNANTGGLASTKNWRVYNAEPATNFFWDINKPMAESGGSLSFPIQEFVSPSEGSFAIYLLNNYNIDMTGKTLTANVDWTSGTYETRSGTGGFVRFVFISAQGNYDSNDYWWSTGNAAPLALSLDAVSSGTLTASLSNCILWTNQSGKSACDTTPNWQQWQGDIVALSPADGFAAAMKNVKQVGLSFGNDHAYASGVALDGGTGAFHMTSFTIAP